MQNNVITIIFNAPMQQKFENKLKSPTTLILLWFRGGQIEAQAPQKRKGPRA